MTPVLAIHGSEMNEALWRWASVKLFNSLDGFGPCSTLGIFDGGAIAGVMVYHNYDRKAAVIEISGVAETAEWLKRHVLREMFAFPFKSLDCQMVVMRVSINDKRLARMLTAYGFNHYKIARLRGRHEDELIFTLTDDDWRNNRFNQKVIVPHGQEISRAA